MALTKSSNFAARLRAKFSTNVSTSKTLLIRFNISEKLEIVKPPTALTAHTPKSQLSLRRRPSRKGEVSKLRRRIIAAKRMAARKHEQFHVLKTGDLDRLFGGDDCVKTTKCTRLFSKKATDTPKKPLWGLKNPKKMELNNPSPTENKNKLMKLFSRRKEPKVPKVVEEYIGFAPWLFDNKPCQVKQSPEVTENTKSYNVFKRHRKEDVSPKPKKARRTFRSWHRSPKVSESTEDKVHELEQLFKKEKTGEQQLSSLEDLETMDELTDNESVCPYETDLDDLYIENLALKEQHLQEVTVHQQLVEGTTPKNATKHLSPEEPQSVETGAQSLVEEQEADVDNEELDHDEPQEEFPPLVYNIPITERLWDWINMSVRHFYLETSPDIYMDPTESDAKFPGSPYAKLQEPSHDPYHGVEDLAPELPEPSGDLEDRVQQVEEPLDKSEKFEGVSNSQNGPDENEESLEEFLGMKEEGWNLLCEVIEGLENGDDPEEYLVGRGDFNESGLNPNGTKSSWYWFYQNEQEEFNDEPVEVETSETENTEQTADNSTHPEEQISLVIVENTEVLEADEVIQSDDEPQALECPEGDEITLKVHLNSHQEENGRELGYNNKRYETPKSCRLFEEDKEILNRWYYITNNYEERYNSAHLQRTGSVGVMPFHRRIQLEHNFFDEMLNDIKLKLLILKVQLNKSRSDIRLLSAMSLSKSSNRTEWSFRRREIEDLIYRIGYNWDIMKSRYFQLISAANQANDVLLSAEEVPEKAVNSVSRINEFLKGVGWEYESLLNLLRVATRCVMWDMRDNDDVNNSNRAPESQPLTNRPDSQEPEEDCYHRQTLDYETHFEHFWHINDLLAGLQRKVFERKKVCRVRGNCVPDFPATVHLL